MKKKEQPVRVESNTGEIFLLTKQKKVFDKIPFWKLYTETVSVLCADPKVWNIPIGFIVWLLENTNYDGELRKTKTDFERQFQVSHQRAFNLFCVAEQAEIIFKIRQIGTSHVWAINPRFFHRGDPKSRKRNLDYLKNERFHYQLERGEIYVEETE